MTSRPLRAPITVIGIVCLSSLLLTAMTATTAGISMMLQFVSAQGNTPEGNGEEDTPSGTSSEGTLTLHAEEPSDDGDKVEPLDTPINTSDQEAGPVLEDTNGQNGNGGGTESLACVKETGAAKGLCLCDTKADCLKMEINCVKDTRHGTDETGWCEWKQ